MCKYRGYVQQFEQYSHKLKFISARVTQLNVSYLSLEIFWIDDLIPWYTYYVTRIHYTEYQYPRIYQLLLDCLAFQPIPIELMSSITSWPPPSYTQAADERLLLSGDGSVGRMRMSTWGSWAACVVLYSTLVCARAYWCLWTVFLAVATFRPSLFVCTYVFESVKAKTHDYLLFTLRPQRICIWSDELLSNDGVCDARWVDEDLIPHDLSLCAAATAKPTLVLTFH